MWLFLVINVNLRDVRADRIRDFCLLLVGPFVDLENTACL
jgi:hypothetical protein